MKIPNFTEKKRKEDVSEFTHLDLVNSIFYKTSPKLFKTPFSSFNIPSLSTVKVTFILNPPTQDFSIISILRDTLHEINGKKIESLTMLEKLSPTMLECLIKSYKEGLMSWREFVLKEIPEFSDTTYSLNKWSIVQSAGIGYIFKDKELSFEQELWISHNYYKQKNFWVDFAINMRESMLPWFNIEMWKKMDDLKKNRRENVDYDSQKEEMLKNIKEEDLDIIK
jgi:hypothetical protein